MIPDQPVPAPATPRPADVAIRTLGQGDAGLLRRMLDMFGAAFDDPVSYGAAQPGDAYLERLLASATFVAIAAVDGGGGSDGGGDGDGTHTDGAVVGGLAGYVLPKFERERSEFYLYDLAVAASHRRRGVATALIDELRRVAAARGAWVIFVQADEGDEPAIRLYSKLGERESVFHFDIRPAGGGSRR